MKKAYLLNFIYLILIVTKLNSQSVLPNTNSVSSSSSTSSLCWIEVSAGVSGTYAIKGDSSLWYWGSGAAATPTQIGNSKWAKVSMGTNHTLFIRQDGTLWAEGTNLFGQLGLSNAVASSPMVQIGTDNNWMEIAAGSEFSVAIKSNGTLWTTGLNSFGQLAIGYQGTGLYGFSLASAAVGITWTKVAAGYFHVLAIDNAGNCYTWGRNNAAQLGNNSTVNSATPIKIVNNIAKEIAAGEGHSACVTTTGLLYTWGWNGVGQIGNSSTINAAVPTLIGGSPNNILKVTCGAQFTLCSNANRQVYGWGSPVAFRLNASISGSAQTSPRLCLTSADSIVKLVSGFGHTALIQKNGQLSTWGLNANGQLGIGTLIDGTNTQVACMTSTLPLTLVSFGITQQETNYQLKWSTKNEVNVGSFEIEESSDGVNFTKIGVVYAKNQSFNLYNFTVNTMQHTMYYRLKMLDKDGLYSYSTVVTLKKKNLPTVLVYPNPASEQLFISHNTKISQYSIIDVYGKVFKTNAFANNSIKIADLPKGVYYVQLHTASGVVVQKFIKE